MFADARTWLADAIGASGGHQRTASAASRQHGSATAARAAAYAPDERQAMLLLLLPFLLMAAAIGLNQSFRYAANLPDIASGPAVTPTPSRTAQQASPINPAAPGPLAQAIRATPRIDLSPSVVAPDRLPSPSPAIVSAAPRPASQAAAAPAAPMIVADATPVANLAAAQPAPLAAGATLPTAGTTPRATPDAVAQAGPPPRLSLAPAGNGTIVIAALPTQPAVSSPRASAPAAASVPAESPPSTVRSIAAPDGSVLALPPSALSPPLAGFEYPADGEGGRRAAFYPPGGICPAGGWGARTASLTSTPPVATIDPDAFGRNLASAARQQLSDMVVYTDQYRRISYPMGDVSPLYGVCTDVVIRAYRALGIDLQALVHVSRVGSGDTSIDHRRVDTLRRFFTANGRSLPITDFAEDYKPGDIVSYYRPQNSHSRSHIALVSDVVGPSGRLMIIHNRGWGPQLEDALFVDEITGHYRYHGLPQDQPRRTLIGDSTSPSVTRASSADAPSQATPRHAAPARPRGKAGIEAVRPTAPAAPRRREARSGGLAMTR